MYTYTHDARNTSLRTLGKLTGESGDSGMRRGAVQLHAMMPCCMMVHVHIYMYIYIHEHLTWAMMGGTDDHSKQWTPGLVRVPVELRWTR